MLVKRKKNEIGNKKKLNRLRYGLLTCTLCFSCDKFIMLTEISSDSCLIKDPVQMLLHPEAGVVHLRYRNKSNNGCLLMTIPAVIG